jgi:chromosomal replication initiation ATPase DnaA
MSTATRPDAVLDALCARGLRELLDAVCAHRGVTPQELCGPQRTQAVVAARHELWWLIRHHPHRHYSWSEIARIVQRDPASILHGVAAHQRRCQHAIARP